MCLREAGHRGTTIMYNIYVKKSYVFFEACHFILLHEIHKILIFKIASYDPFKCFSNKVLKILFKIFIWNIYINPCK